MDEFEAMEYEAQGQILGLLADIQRGSTPIELSVGWTDSGGTVRQGIVVKSAPPIVAQKLVEAGYCLTIAPQGVVVTRA